MPAEYPQTLQTTEEKLSFLEVEYDKLIDKYVQLEQNLKIAEGSNNNWKHIYETAVEVQKAYRRLILDLVNQVKDY